MSIVIAASDSAHLIGAATAGGDGAGEKWTIAAAPGSGIVVLHGDSELATTVLHRLQSAPLPDDAIQQVIEGHAERAQQQVVAVRVDGRTGAFSGRAVVPVFGHARGTDHAAAGQRMASNDPLGAMSLSMERSGGDSLSERLLLALESGLRSGADLLGLRCAQLVVIEKRGGTVVDLRVEDHNDPAGELRRLLGTP